uniref:Nop domain-containing protein n=1 Tax=Parastrongyloides trichosuri TaxID=131310 RepID=A0A0N4Z1P3_PARTI
MFVLFDNPAGFAIFKLLDDGKIKKIDQVFEEFGTVEKCQKNLELVKFYKFKDVEDGVSSISALQNGKMAKSLKKALKKTEDLSSLIVGDSKIGAIVKENLDIECEHNKAIAELFRCLRLNADELFAEDKDEIHAMQLALAHGVSRFKVKFNPEKIDTMIVQAVSLLDDLDKELNNYVMRLREWYGWHFPELGKILTDHQAYAKTVKAIRMKEHAINTDLSTILPEELESKVKEEAELSMGTAISEEDMIHISALCDEVLGLTQYRTDLAEYLRSRMNALAPNLTALVGELVGARLIAHAGSLVNLAKYPASTVQILGAEKALFRALKTKKDTPKYGLIYHAQLIGQAGQKMKGKMARKLAAKVSLSTRIDALCDESLGNEAGIEARAYLEKVLHDDQNRMASNGVGGVNKNLKNLKFKSEVYSYDDANDDSSKKNKKRKNLENGTDEGAKKAKVIKEEEEDNEE